MNETSTVDAGLLRAYIEESLRTFQELQGHVDPDAAPGANERVSGAILALQQVLTELQSGRFSPAKTPMSQIRPAPRSKVRRRDPQTSWDAAIAQTPEKSQRLYSVIYDLLTKKPLTDEQIIRVLTLANFPHTASGVRTRRSELVDAGWIEDSGLRRDTEAGGQSIVWRVVE